MRHKPDAFDRWLSDDTLAIFRRTPLALGEQNWPDKPVAANGPDPRPWYGLPWRERLVGYRVMFSRLRDARRLGAKWSDFRDTLTGAPLAYWLPGVGAVTDASLGFAYYAARLQSLLRPPKSVVEIGAGFGGLSEVLLRRWPIDRYIIVDLPEGLVMAEAYLRGCGHAPRVLINGDEPVPERGVVLMGPWCLGSVAADLAINTMSFHHMTHEAVEFYLKRLAGVRALYSVNRLKAFDPTDVPADEYPIPPSLTLTWRSDRLYYGAEERLYQRSC